MRLNVVNDAAPVVRIVNPADGAQLISGSAITVRVEGEDAHTLSMAVDGTDTWSGGGDVITGRWSPATGTHRLVAVARREGAPDAVASSTVEVVEPGAPEGATPPPPTPTSGGTTPPVAPIGPALSAPGAPAPARPGGGPPDEAGTRAPRPATPRADRATLAGAPSLSPGAAPRHESPSPVIAVARAIRRLLSSPERVAWMLAFPLLLMIAAAAYALLQRFIDGGPKLAWRGRGQCDDSVIEF